MVDDSSEVAELSFDDALDRLEALAQQLEAGDIPLEQALEVYERAVGLFRHCSARLSDVEQRLEVLTRDLDGEQVTTPLEGARDLLGDG